jgi:hypothetical protein
VAIAALGKFGISITLVNRFTVTVQFCTTVAVEAAESAFREMHIRFSSGCNSEVSMTSP